MSTVKKHRYVNSFFFLSMYLDNEPNKSDPLDVEKVVLLSRAMRRKMQENLWWAAGYNMIAFPIAAGILYIPQLA